jgi:hypothetical protein
VAQLSKVGPGPVSIRLQLRQPFLRKDDDDGGDQRPLVKLPPHKAVVRPSCAVTCCPLCLWYSEISDCHLGAAEDQSVVGLETLFLVSDA